MHIQSLLAAAFAGVVIIGFLLSSCTPQTEQENAEKMQIPRVSGVIAEQLVQQGALLLDVRTPQEFQQKHLAGAVNLPVNELAERLDEIPTETTIIVYCRSGRRSAKAVGILIDAKRDAKNLGGMTAWPSK